MLRERERCGAHTCAGNQTKYGNATTRTSGQSPLHRTQNLSFIFLCAHPTPPARKLAPPPPYPTRFLTSPTTPPFTRLPPLRLLFPFVGDGTVGSQEEGCEGYRLALTTRPFSTIRDSHSRCSGAATTSNSPRIYGVAAALRGGHRDDFHRWRRIHTVAAALVGHRDDFPGGGASTPLSRPSGPPRRFLPVQLHPLHRTWEVSSKC